MLLIIPMVLLAGLADEPLELPSLDSPCAKTDYLGKWEFHFDICDMSGALEVLVVDLKEGEEAVEDGNRSSGKWEWTSGGFTLNILNKKFSEDPLGGECGKTMAGTVRLSPSGVLACFSATKQ